MAADGKSAYGSLRDAAFFRTATVIAIQHSLSTIICLLNY